jgi:hypothetical protein
MPESASAAFPESLAGDPANHLRRQSQIASRVNLIRFLELSARPPIFDPFTGIGKPEHLRYGL